MAQYPGYVMRQLLVEESQKRADELRAESDKVYALMETKGLDDKSKVDLSEQYYFLLGQIKGLRAINEWAKKHTLP